MKDSLVVLKKMNVAEKAKNNELGKQIINSKRNFVSEIQKIIDPRENERFFGTVREPNKTFKFPN